MKHVYVKKIATAPNPGDIAAYLRSRGWIRRPIDEHWSSFYSTIDDVEMSIDVPLRGNTSDYSLVAERLLEELSRIEDRKPSMILRDIWSGSTDIARFHFVGPGASDGALSLDQAQHIHAGARVIALAAACSTISPLASFPTRKYSDADDFVKRARVGLPEYGSYVLTVESDVTPRLTESYDVSDEPFERQAMLSMAMSLRELVLAVTEAETTDSLTPFVHGVKRGISANLCEGSLLLFRGGNIDSVDVDFSFAARRPIDMPPLQTSTLSKSIVPILKEAARELRKVPTAMQVTLEGAVTRLDSAAAHAGGRISIVTILDGRYRTVHMDLDASDYAKAVEAHQNEALISVDGHLMEEARKLTLMSPENFLRLTESQQLHIDYD